MQGSLIAVYGGYNTMGEEFGADLLEVGAVCCVDVGWGGVVGTHGN